jgi:hypothetical protein
VPYQDFTCPVSALIQDLRRNLLRFSWESQWPCETLGVGVR